MGIEEKVEKKNKKGIWEKMFNSSKLKKPKKVAVLYLRNNNIAEPHIVDTKRGFFVIEGKTYHIERDCLYTMTKERIPLAVIPEDGLIPEGNSEYYKNLKTLKDFEKRVARHQDLALNAIRHAELVKMGERDGPKINAKVAIGIIILAIIAIAILKNYV